ncbi:MAG: DNA mismatch repair endonuclease MutL [Schleiferiaceae bacterium]|nr:DNA mismatch repair endonuclease MutL [Schleiferiaceae bacterium]
MPPSIHHLPEEVANQIAAGEVVQRPASIVKELIENSLDAGATEITVLIHDAGRTSIQVIDNGSGIDADDLPSAFARHATSKLRSADDLFALNTLGFRGEALASISAVSHSNIKSRTADEPAATELSCEGGKLGTPKKVAGALGTAITAKNLFFNVPARRQFLKNDTIEFRHISETFTSIALAQPQTRLILKHNGKDVWLLEAGNPRQRVTQILGRKANERLVPIEEKTDVVHCDGFVLRPEHARKTRGDQYLYVNRRPIRSGYLHKAVTEAFAGLLPVEHHPAYVLYLKVPADRVDVNVHPAKTEVKFEDDRVIYAILRSAVKRALGIHQVTPTLDFETNLQHHVNWDLTSQPEAPKVHVNPDYNPFRTPSTSGQRGTAKESFDFFAPPRTEAASQASLAWEPLEETPESGVHPASFCLLLPPHFAIASLKNGLVTVHVPRARRHIFQQKTAAALQLGEGITAQTWLFPEVLDLPSTSRWEAWVDILPRLGFQWTEEEGERRLVAGPYFLEPSEAMEWLESILAAHPEHTEDALQQAINQWLSNWAYKKSMPQATDLPALLDELFALDNPWVNAQGKAIARILDGEALSAQFQ